MQVDRPKAVTGGLGKQCEGPIVSKRGQNAYSDLGIAQDPRPPNA
jgi:hypothetical protein